MNKTLTSVTNIDENICDKNNTIINLIGHPMLVDEAEWLILHIGRTSVALETNQAGTVSIIAYSDNNNDEKALKQIAIQAGGYLIRNISSKGVDYVD